MANKKRVMIVDDDPDILKSVTQILEKNGYKVYSFDNGFDCIKTLNEGIKPSLIILDIMMPLMSGWQIHKRLGENPKWRKIPVAFLTARTNCIAEEMYERYGITYIKKPFDIKDFIGQISEILIERQKYSKEMYKCHNTSY